MHSVGVVEPTSMATTIANATLSLATTLVDTTAAVVSSFVANTTTPVTTTTTTTTTATLTTTTTTTTNDVFFTLGKFDFTAETAIGQWLAVFLVPAVYFAVLLLTLMIDVATCSRCCARLKHGKHIEALDVSTPVGHAAHVRRSQTKSKHKKKKQRTKPKKPARRDSQTAAEAAAAARVESQKAYVY